MSKHFLNYKESLELKELGFNEFCYGHIDPHEYVDSSYSPLCMGEYNMEPNEDDTDTLVACPMFFQVFEWFESKHSMFIDRSIMTNVNEIMSIEYRIKSWKFAPVEVEFDSQYDSFDLDKAQLACVRKLIEILKTK